MEKMSSLKRLVSGLALTCAVALSLGTSLAKAEGNDTGNWWQDWGTDLYVSWMRENPDGSITVQLVKNTGAPATTWTNTAGSTNNYCNGKSELSIHAAFPARENLRKILTASALAQTPVRVAIDSWSASGCWLKGVQANFRTPQ